MVDMGISSTIMVFLSQMLHDIRDMTIYNDILNRSDITPICELISEQGLITDFDLVNISEVSIEYFNGCD